MCHPPGWSIPPTRTATACHHVRMSTPPPLGFSFVEPTLMPPIRLATGDASAGAFLIDPDRAEQFITEVRDAAAWLDRAKSAATYAGAVEPSPGGDPVTENAAVQAKKMAKNCWTALDAYQRQLFATADQLQDQLAAYRAAEQANTARRR